MSLKLYANLVSQPSRAVAWLLKVKQVEHELVPIDFATGYHKSDEFRKLNPNGFVPVLKDGDFVLFEGHAIMAYLAAKYDWEELYPKELKARAKVDEYLHWHHTNVRKFTLDIVRPVMKKTLGSATPEELELANDTRPVLIKVLDVLEKMFTADYVAATAQPTIADYSMYCEFDQLELMGLLTDLEDYPKTVAWLARMKEIPFHDEIRVTMNQTLTALGMASKA